MVGEVGEEDGERGLGKGGGGGMGGFGMSEWWGKIGECRDETGSWKRK